MDSDLPSNLHGEHLELKDGFQSLFSANEGLQTMCKTLQGDCKVVKTESNTIKLKLAEIDGELNHTRNQMSTLGVEVSKLTNQCQYCKRRMSHHRQTHDLLHHRFLCC